MQMPAAKQRSTEEIPSAAGAFERVGCSLLTYSAAGLDEALDRVRAHGFKKVDLAVVPGHCDHVDLLALSEGGVEELSASLRRCSLRPPRPASAAGGLALARDDRKVAVVIALLRPKWKELGGKRRRCSSHCCSGCRRRSSRRRPDRFMRDNADRIEHSRTPASMTIRTTTPTAWRSPAAFIQVRTA